MAQPIELYIFQKPKMAALSIIKNKKSQRLREGFDDLMIRCVDGGAGGTEVELDHVAEIFENMNIKIDAKELQKMEKLAGENKKIPR